MTDPAHEPRERRAADHAPREHGGAIGTITGWLDRPWKVVSVVLLVLVGLPTFLIYEARDDIRRIAIRDFEQPYLIEARVPAEFARLARGSGADIVLLWTVQLGSNEQRFHSGLRRPVSTRDMPATFLLTAIDEPFASEQAFAPAVIALMNATTICFDPTLSTSAHMRELVDYGAAFVCNVRVPSVSGVFVGLIQLAWLQVPPPAAQEVALRLARQVASNLAWWP